MPDDKATQIASRLDRAWEGRQPIQPLTEAGELSTPAEAYRVQMAWTDLRLACGDGLDGRKIGLTSRAMQEQMGVDEPDYGSLWSSRRYDRSGDAVEVPVDPFIQPKVEGELAFLIGTALPAGEVGMAEVLGATEAVATCVEIVDSRIEDWRIRLPDTIADNASYGGYAIGPWSRSLADADLAAISMRLERGGEPVAEGTGAAALGHPARSVAWLASKLRSFGVELEPGQIVLSGALARAIDVRRGDDFTLRFDGEAPLSVRFS